jgi:two-component system NtrC family sensor kinase
VEAQMSGELILVIDDSNAIVSLLTEEILPHGGFRATGARTGAGGLELLGRVQPALVLLDFELPDMTGLDVLQRMRDAGYAVPTILMTAYGSEAIAAQALRLGVRDYLIKPLTAEEVLHSINSALTEHRLRQEKSVLHDRLSQQNRVLLALQNVGMLTTSKANLDEMLMRAVDASLFVTGAESGFLALIEDSSTLVLRAARNLPADQGQRIPLGPDDAFARLLRQGRPHRQVAEGLNPAALHIPLVSRGQPLGVLAVTGRPANGEFNEQDERALNALGCYIALTLESMRLRASIAEERASRTSEKLAAFGLKQGGQPS